MSNGTVPTLSLGPSILLYFESSPPTRIALFVIGTLLFLGCTFISFLQIIRHVQAGLQERKTSTFFPSIRRRIINQILWVQISVFFSYVSLLFPRIAVLFTFVQTTYQAWALFGFVRLMSDFVGGKRGAIRVARNVKTKLYAVPPFACCFAPCANEHFLTSKRLVWARIGVLQSTLVQPLLSFLAIFLQLQGLYAPGSFDPDNAYIYILVIAATSTMISMYFIAVIHRGLQSSISAYNVRKKFLLVKILVPLFTVQSLFIALIYNNAHPKDTVFPRFLASTLYERFIVLIEGIPLAILCYYAYPVHGEVDYRAPFASAETQTYPEDLLLEDEDQLHRDSPQVAGKISMNREESDDDEPGLEREHVSFIRPSSGNQ